MYLIDHLYRWRIVNQHVDVHKYNNINRLKSEMWLIHDSNQRLTNRENDETCEIYVIYQKNVISQFWVKIIVNLDMDVYGYSQV